MDGIAEIVSWVTEHEALLSGLAAMVAIAALFPAVARPLLRRRDSVSAISPNPARRGKRQYDGREKGKEKREKGKGSFCLDLHWEKGVSGEVKGAA